MSFSEFQARYTRLLESQMEGYLDSCIPTVQEKFISEGYSLIREYVLSGGKRLRPLAMALAYSACGGKDEHRIMLPAIAIELHHNYSIILDDIMDEDESRRGKPTVYQKLKIDFIKEFKEEEYDGSLFTRKSSRFAVSNAMMLGNITNLLSSKAIIKSDFDDEAKVKALKLIEKADEELYHGQMMDVLMEYKEKATEHEYMEMAKLKTGMLFGLSMQLGSLLAGADESVQHTFKEIGIDSAVAFQIQDDLIDITLLKGHGMGSDIRKGKMTLLMIKTLQLCDERQRQVIRLFFKNPEAGDEGIRKVIQIIHETKADEFCAKVASGKIIRAKSMVDGMKTDLLSKNLIMGLISSMVERRA